MKKLPQLCAAVGIILLLAVLFGRTLIPPHGQMIFGGDIYDAYYYWKGYLQETVRSGVLPFWNPYNFSGTPFLAHPNINIFYPPNWLFLLLPLPAAFAWYFFLHLLVAAGSMYLLARQCTTRIGALTAAAVYCLGGFFAARIYSGHLEYVDASSWVPLAVAGSLRVIQQVSWRRVVQSGAAFALLLLAGNELFFLFTAEICGLCLLFFLVTAGRQKTVAQNSVLIAAWCLSIGLGIGLAGAEVLPRLEFIRSSLRSTGLSYETAASGSLPWQGLALFVAPYLWGNPFPEAYTYHGLWPNLFEFTYYTGLVPLALLAWFVCSKGILLLYRRRRVSAEPTVIDLFFSSPFVWLFSLILLVFLLISLGSTLPLNIHYLLWNYTPLYKGIRFPARHLFVVFLSLSVLTGIAVGQIKQRWVQGVLILFLVLDLIYFDWSFIRLSPLPVASIDQPLAAAVIRDKDLYRVLPDFPVVSPVRRDLDFGDAARDHFFSTSDYNSMIVGRYYQFIDILNQSPGSSLTQYNVEIPPPNPNSPLINFLNVRYVIADKQANSVDTAAGRYVPVLSGERYQLYKNTQALPRFYLVHTAQVVNSPEEMERQLRLSPDLSQQVIVLRQPQMLATAFRCEQNGDAVSVVSYSTNKIVLDVSAACDAFLSTSEVYYPGWRATIDGKDAPIYLSNYAFRALVIPAGRHQVEMRYVPRIFYAGIGVSLLTLIVLGLMPLRRRLYDAKKI